MSYAVVDCETLVGANPIWSNVLTLTGMLSPVGKYYPISPDIRTTGMLAKPELLIGHNLTFDLCALAHRGYVNLRGHKYFDTLTALKHISTNEPTYALKPWATYLGYPPYWLRFDAALAAGTTNLIPDIELQEYNKYDVLVTHDLYKHTKKIIDNKAFQLDMKTLPLICEMMISGIGLDQEVLEQEIEVLRSRSVGLEVKLIAQYGTVNFGSPKQVAALLYDKLGLKPPRGSRSVNEEALRELNHPLVSDLLERRGALKLLSTYLLPLRGLPRAYGDFRLSGTASGRLACHQPPLQTYPEALRKIFKPRIGTFVWADLDQIEFKLIADMSGELELIKAINSGWDVHEAVGQLLGTDRGTAKTLNYAKAYGAGRGKLASVMGSYAGAIAIERLYANKFPKIEEMIHQTHRQVERTGKVVTPFGRKREFEIDSTIAEKKVLWRNQREGFNHIIQGFAHELLQLFWIALDEAFQAESITYQYCIENHDELLLDVDNGQVEKVKSIITEVLDRLPELCFDMCSYRLKIKPTATIHNGEKWL